MKDRLLTLAGALLALYVAAVLLMPAGPGAAELSRPTTTDTGDAGLAGLYRWLEREGVPVLSLRQRYQALPGNPALAPTGNLLIATLPQRSRARWRETETLRAWLRRGNSVLMLLALDDRPDWRTALPSGAPYALLTDLFGLSVRYRNGTGEPSLVSTDEKEIRLLPQGDHPLLRGVDTVVASVHPSTHDWQLSGIEGTALRLLCAGDGSGHALWQLRIGAGRLWLASYSSLFANGALDRADNARLMANMAALALTSGGTVIFDDMHQGLSRLYDPAAFFADTRLHSTLWFLLALWLLWVAGGSNRLVPPRAFRARPQGADLVRAAGGFFARCLDPRAAGAELLRHFFNDLRRRFSMPTNGEPVWERLSRSPRVGRDDLETLRRLHARLASGHTVDLAALHNLTLKIKKDLS